MSDDGPLDILNGNAQQALKSIMSRLDRLDDEGDEIKEQKKEVFAEAKGNGFDTKAIRKLRIIMKQDRAKRQEELAILQLYASAMGLEDLV